MARKPPPRKARRTTSRRTTRRLTQVALKELTAALSAETGEQFFAALTRYLATALGVDFAFVGELALPTSNRIRSLSVFAHGAPA